MTRDEITDKLRQGVYSVTFKKIDGTERTMPCTLREDMLPPAKKDEPLTQKRVRQINEDVLVVYCTDKQAFRSFRVANVINIQPYEE